MRIANLGIVSAAMIFLTLAGAQAQTFTLLRQFQGNFDGTLPHGALLRDAAGNLYGTTFSGANHNCQGGGCGSVFKLSATGNETMLHRFIQTDGALPTANLQCSSLIPPVRKPCSIALIPQSTGAPLLRLLFWTVRATSTAPPTKAVFMATEQFLKSPPNGVDSKIAN